jgi:hypothetical protein
MYGLACFGSLGPNSERMTIKEDQFHNLKKNTNDEKQVCQKTRNKTNNNRRVLMTFISEKACRFGAYIIYVYREREARKQQKRTASTAYTGFLFCLFFDPEDESGIIPRRVWFSSNYTMIQARKSCSL